MCTFLYDIRYAIIVCRNVCLIILQMVYFINPLKSVPNFTQSHVSTVYVYSQSSHSSMLQELQKQAFNLVQICRAELFELLTEWNCRVPCTVFTRCVCDRYKFVTSQNILCTRCFLVACSPMTDAHHFTIDAASRRWAPANFIPSH